MVCRQQQDGESARPCRSGIAITLRFKCGTAGSLRRWCSSGGVNAQTLAPCASLGSDCVWKASWQHSCRVSRWEALLWLASSLSLSLSYKEFPSRGAFRLPLLRMLFPCADCVVWESEWRGLLAPSEQTCACGMHVLTHAVFCAMMEWNVNGNRRGLPKSTKREYYLGFIGTYWIMSACDIISCDLCVSAVS